MSILRYAVNVRQKEFYTFDRTVCTNVHHSWSKINKDEANYKLYRFK